MLKPAVSREECAAFEWGGEASRQQLLAFRGFIRRDIRLTGLWQRVLYIWTPDGDGYWSSTWGSVEKR